MTQPSLFQEVEVMDLVADLLYQMGHTGALEDVQRWEQTRRPLVALLEHPLYKEAAKRKQDKFWARMKRASTIVESWPDWKKGSRVNS